MNGYVTLGTNDLGSAALFYEQLLESIGVKRQRETPRSVYFGSESGTELVVITPADEKSATAGNGKPLDLSTLEASQAQNWLSSLRRTKNLLPQATGRW